MSTNRGHWPRSREFGSVVVEFAAFWVLAMIVYVAVVRRIDHPIAASR